MNPAVLGTDLDEVERLKARVAELEALLRECAVLLAECDLSEGENLDLAARIRAKLREQT